jgi:hypothetical protein
MSVRRFMMEILRWQGGRSRTAVIGPTSDSAMDYTRSGS